MRAIVRSITLFLNSVSFFFSGMTGLRLKLDGFCVFCYIMCGVALTLSCVSLYHYFTERKAEEAVD